MSMQFFFSKNFAKQYKKLPRKIQIKFNERMLILIKNEMHPLLNVHVLKSAKAPLYSMNVTSDYRSLFLKDENKIFFQEIGSHSELY